MGKRKLADEQILHALREPEFNDSVAAICGEHGYTYQAFEAWRNEFIQELPEFAELQQLRQENEKLRSAVVKLNVDRQILKDVFAKRR